MKSLFGNGILSSMRLSEKLLNGAVEHIQYEIDMFRLSGKYLLYQDNVVLHNALVEIFAIHSRNLFIFFYTDVNKRVQDDILAEDFINRKELFINHRSPIRQLKFILKKANKQVSHLTYSRNKYNTKDKEWPIYKITITMEKTIDVFLEALPEEKKSWFK